MSSPKRNEFSRQDLSSLSNPHEVRSDSLQLRWNLLFPLCVIKGSATHSLTVVLSGAKKVKFDSSKLLIERVEVNGKPGKFERAETSPSLGSSLAVEVPEDCREAGSTFEVTFYYSTDKDASAVQWLNEKATSSGKYPFVFTQCEAIHARSLFPCQDTPLVKTPYKAVVTVPKWCVVLMSALQDGEPTYSEEGDTCTYRWSQPVPIPSYLVALAAGELESREISPRVKVWAEPKVVEAASFEFSETEMFLKAAESLTLPYEWKRYDVLCLPPSFPYGGMENPCLTFATPTLLAGDKSLADVIAHEIAHSWTGNLITNCTWEHFWLNEGWTMWLERKIMAKVKNSAELKLSAQIGWKCLEDDVKRFGEDSRFTQIVWPLTGEDPDEAFSVIPYEKGFNLLYQLECIVGTSEFEAFAKEYLEKFKFSTVSSGEFRNFFCEKFGSLPAVKALDWNDLFYGRGMPTHTPDFSNPLSENAEYLAEKWIQWNKKSEVPWGVGQSDIDGWSSKQKCVFLERLLKYAQEDMPLSLDILAGMDLAYQFTSNSNSELKYRWQMLCLLSEAEWIVPHVVDFITTQGRMKFVRPLYLSLHDSKVGAKVARETFEKHHEMYHPIAKKMVASDLGVSLAKLNKAQLPPSHASKKASSESVSKPTEESTNLEDDSSTFYSILTTAAVAGAAMLAFTLLKRR